MYDVVILGAGPAGLAAAIYTARAKMKTLVVSGPMVGGQIAFTYQVDNYPGFPEGITGPELSEKMKAHAERFGAEFVDASVTSIDLKATPRRLKVGGVDYEVKSVIVATGMNHRRLGVPGEERLMGRGVFVCATCDAALYDDLKVVVVGGGDSAMQEALDLSRFASEVNIVIRKDRARACSCLLDMAFDEPKVKISYNTEVTEIFGEKRVTGVKLRDIKTGESRVAEADGVLLAIGWIPNTDILKGQLELDDEGFPVTDGVKTRLPGVYVAGDLMDRVYRQVVTSSGSGCAAALEAIHWLEGIPSG